MMTSCDTLLMVGSNFPYAQFLPKEGQWTKRDERIDDARAAVVVDPTVSMLPPHITFEQARSFASAMLHGAAQEGPVIASATLTGVSVPRCASACSPCFADDRPRFSPTSR